MGGLNWFVTGSVADGEGESPAPIEAPKPVEIPAGFDLTALMATPYTAGSITARIEIDAAGNYVVIAKNDGESAESVELKLDIYEHRGSMVSRMIPPPTLVGSEICKIEVSPGTEARYTVTTVKAPKKPEPVDSGTNNSGEIEGMLALTFANIEFRIGPAAGAEPVTR